MLPTKGPCSGLVRSPPVRPPLPMHSQQAHARHTLLPAHASKPHTRRHVTRHTARPPSPLCLPQNEAVVAELLMRCKASSGEKISQGSMIKPVRGGAGVAVAEQIRGGLS